MIKVNLLRNLGGSAANSRFSRQSLGTGAFSTDASVNKKAGLKILAVLGPILILFGIEKYNISIKSSQLEEIKADIVKKNNEIKSYGDTGPMVEKYTTMRQKLDKQFDALQVIAINRLREVKTLDTLQTIIPGRNWINELNIEDGKVNLQGLSETPDAAFAFVKVIEESPNFSEVSKLKVEADESVAATAKYGEGLKKYSFEFRIGKK